ncbi:CLUMA_CG014733, isoform A [Clunio marinus]|uniref:CLUMA_CG014733, isoform A n=1 Tax=Clunio marinus TaxID=568069 RepID=A0A1J1ILU8_9DIPT|nr:CLUMA_CG014733, isoform A [Clunio marinus]
MIKSSQRFNKHHQNFFAFDLRILWEFVKTQIDEQILRTEKRKDLIFKMRRIFIVPFFNEKAFFTLEGQIFFGSNNLIKKPLTFALFIHKQTLFTIAIQFRDET